MLNCNWQAVLIAVVAFVVPYAVVLASTDLFVPKIIASLPHEVVALIALPVVLGLVLVGYFAARTAGESGVANGAATGLLISIVLLVGPFFALNVDTGVLVYLQEFGPHALVMGVFWCSLGGLIHELIVNYRPA